MTAFAHLCREAQRARRIFGSEGPFSNLVQLARRFRSGCLPRRVLIITKISRYQIEKQANPHLNEEQLKNKLQVCCDSYNLILAGHQRNNDTQLRTINALKRYNIPYRITNRYNIDQDSISWADFVICIGGDGTFLLASNLIWQRSKPVVGINSDPENSEGFLMLPSKYTNDIALVIERIKAGHFEFLMRSRIRTTLYGDNVWHMPFHLHSQNSNQSKTFYQKQYEATKPKGQFPNVRQLPWLALNEVFIGESVSARISNLHVKTDNKFKKVKCSGVCVTTGTGSTSWYTAINSLNPQVVKDVLSMADYERKLSDDQIKKICLDFNRELQYPPDQLRLAYVIREMVVNHTMKLPNLMDSRGFCKELKVQSQCHDGGLVIDGGVTVHFNIGTTAMLECLKEDQLRCVIFPD